MAYPETIDDVHSGIGDTDQPLNNPSHVASHHDVADAVLALMTFVGTESDGRLDEPGNIKMHNINYAPIPSGWVECDGDNGTPDMRGLFPVGRGGAYSYGDTGGANSVSPNLASHVHGSGSLVGGSHTHSAGNYIASNHTHGSGSLTSGNTNINHNHGSGSLVAGNTNISGASHSHILRRSRTNSSNHTHVEFFSAEEWQAIPTRPSPVSAFSNSSAGVSGGSHNHGNHSHSISGNTSGSGSATNHAHNVGGNTNSVSPSVGGNSLGAGVGISGSTGGTGPSVGGNSGSSSVGVSGSTASAGEDTAQENRPPYRALVFIMKL